MFFSKLLLAVASMTAMPVVVMGEAPPAKAGFKIVWKNEFQGAKGTTVDPSAWNIVTGPNNANGELEVYTASSNNHHHTGDNTLVIIPKGSLSAGWTSARLESKRTFTPANGKKTVVQAKIRFGNNAVANKQGIWPAFWMLGDSIRHGTPWPACGEIDILETVDGRLTGYGTVHCDVSPGGVCHETTGLGGTTAIANDGWNEWNVQIDRTHSDWRQNAIIWHKNGVQYWKVTGATIGNQAVWQSLVTKPLYIILNVAVGGGFPGNPNAQTRGGAGSQMEVAYVAQYVSN